jgi:hypothetical protein
MNSFALDLGSSCLAFMTIPGQASHISSMIALLAFAAKMD